ncbi:polysaccharide biosynthesis protein [Paenibacillus sp. VTT E-133291]|nr:polysaccharide biosynthesis protein [Paenibacillus sp. VTT E-133291]
MTKKTLFNSGWLITDKLITMIIGIFITAIIARYLGPENYGEFNYALAFVSLFTAISTLGLEVLTVKSIVNKEENEGTILFTSLLLRILGGIILIVFSTIAIKIIEPTDFNLHILVLIMSFSMLIKSFEVIEYWIQAYQLARVSSIIRILTTIVTALLKLGLVFFKGGLITFSLIYTIDAIIVSVALMISYFKLRENKSIWNISISYARKMLQQSWYLILSGLMITLYMRLDQVMLGYMMDTKDELGIYSASARIAEMWYFVPMAVITSFRPVIMKKKNDEVGFLDSLQRLYQIIAWMGILFGIFIILLSKPIILILYGTDYLDAAKILSVSVWAGTFAMLGSARSIWLVCQGLQKFTLAYTFGGLIVNVILNYLFIPIYGALGAAVATLASQFFANIVVLLLFKKTRLSSIMILKAFSPKFNFKK